MNILERERKRFALIASVNGAMCALSFFHLLLSLASLSLSSLSSTVFLLYLLDGTTVRQPGQQDDDDDE